MISIGERLDSLGKTTLKSLVDNHRATGGLLLEETAILPMTAKAGCGIATYRLNCSRGWLSKSV